MISDVTSLEGTVDKIDGKLILLIPLEAGGDQFVECCRGISEIQGEDLAITIPEWLSGMLRIKEGSLVCVQNENGKFNIYPVHPLPIH